METVRVGKARRAKLYYLRDRLGKAAKTKENVGARIENKEIVLKEEMPATEEVEEVKAEATVAEAPVTETPAEEVKAEVADKDAENVAEEAKTEETSEKAENK